MKFLIVDRCLDKALSECPKVEMFADSSLILPGRPVFLPDFAEGGRIEILPCFRISRLGKNIAPRFAYRYFDSMTLAARIIPPGATERDNVILSAFDGSITLGKWITCGADGIIRTSICNDSVSLDSKILKINETIAILSRYMTLKNGDIIAPCHIETDLTAMVDLTLSCSLNEMENVLNLRIK